MSGVIATLQRFKPLTRIAPQGPTAMALDVRPPGGDFVYRYVGLETLSGRQGFGAYGTASKGIPAPSGVRLSLC
ncbi:MAG: hypothetical protein ACI8PT_003292 [Gammaproteobacteria bacterium]|jgi:hypothetical protein